MDVRSLAVDRLLRQYGVHLQLVRLELGSLLVHHVTAEIPSAEDEEESLLYDRLRLGSLPPLDPAGDGLASDGRTAGSRLQQPLHLRYGFRGQHRLQSEILYRFMMENVSFLWLAIKLSEEERARSSITCNTRHCHDVNGPIPFQDLLDRDIIMQMMKQK